MRKVFLINAFIICMLFFSCSNSKGTSPGSVSANLVNSCFVTQNGSLYYSGLEMGGSRKIVKNKKIKTETKVKKAICSTTAILFLDTSDDVYILGRYYNAKGEIENSNIPNQIKSLSQIIDIKAGDMHFLALDKNKKLWAWGNNNYGQVSPEKGRMVYKPIKVLNQSVNSIECGFYTSSAIADGNVIIWGEDDFDLQKNGMKKFETFYELSRKNVKKISIGRNHIILENDEGLFGYGSDALGQLSGKKDQADEIKLNLNKVTDFSCSLYGSVFLIEGKIYYWGIINPLEEQKNSKGFKQLKISNIGKVKFMDCKADSLIVIDETGRTKMFPENNNIKREKSQQPQGNLKIGMVDTGVDFKNRFLRGCKGIHNSEKIDNLKQISKWNFCKGNQEIYEDVINDWHGTAVYSLLKNIKIVNGQRKENDADIIVLKALDSSGGKVVDIFSAFKIANYNNVNILNCSFSIENSLYKNIFTHLIQSSDLLYIFACNNNSTKGSVYLSQQNVIYTYDKNQSIETPGNKNILSVDLSDKKVIDYDGKLKEARSNSFAAAVLTEKIYMQYKREKFDLDYQTIIKNYNNN